jgi:hypothetical protein
MGKSRSSEPKVWEFYDFLKTIRLNWKYYKQELLWKRKISNAFEILLAITAPGSALAGFSAWQFGAGKVLWMVLGVLAALFSLAKPILKINKKIERLEKVTQRYAVLDGECFALASDIRHRECYDDKHYDQFQRLLKERNQAKTDMADEVENRRKIEKLQDEVNCELPADNFYIPGG